MAAVTSFGKRGVARPAPVSAPVAVRAPSEETQKASAAKPSRLSRIPYASFLLTVILVLIFIVEGRHALDAGPGMTLSHRAIVAMGGVDAQLVFGKAQWWRLFTAPLLHGSIEHIAGNATVLLLVGWLLEPLIGTWWFAAIFAVGAFGGAWASTLMNAPDIVSVGASGAIMALLTATFVCSFHDEADGVARRMRWLSVRLILPSLLPSLAGGASHTDFSAHTGGAIAGVVMGFALMILWREGDARPGYRRIAACVVAFAIVMAGLSFWMAAQASPIFEATQTGLIPQNEMPRDTTSGIAASENLVPKYPADPRAHLFRGMHFLQIEDIADAGPQLRMALDGLDAVRDQISPQVEPVTRILLADVLVAQGRQPEAIAIAKSACDSPELGPSFDNALQYLRDSKVCQ